MQRELTPAEITDLLNRNTDLQAKVLVHQQFVDAGQWDQIGRNESVYRWGQPIPPKGLAYRDERFGVVVVFPDARGKLHYSGFVGAGVLAGDIAETPYESPTGNTLTQAWEDFQRGFGVIVAGIVVVGVVYVIVVNQ